MNQELKAIEILTKLSNSMKNNEGIINWDCSIDFFNKTNEAIKELEEYEQNFKQKEFDYRTDCQKVLSTGRIEADNMPDRLAELEKSVLDYYLDKGYRIGVGCWDFKIQIITKYKSKLLIVFFSDYNLRDIDDAVYILNDNNTKDMFDRAIEYFSTRQNEVVEKKQST